MTSTREAKKEVEILKRALNVGPEPEWKKRHEKLQPILARLEEIGWNSQELRDSAKHVAEQYAKQLKEGYKRVWNPEKDEYEWRKPT